jgi:predicted transcriptional regulator
MIDIIEMNALLTKRVWKEMNWLTLNIEPKSRNIFNHLPNSMQNAERVMRAAFQSDEKLREVMKEVLGELGLSAREFSKASGIPQSTLYKILSGHREPNITTMRQIVKTILHIEGSEGNFIAIIAARPVLDKISEKKMKIGEKMLTLREYSATTIEEAIIAAIRAERDGAAALVCAPIVSPTVEKILSIPVATIIPRDSVIRAIEVAARKIE